MEQIKYCSICGTPLQEELSGNEVSPGTGGRNRESEQSGSVKKKEATVFSAENVGKTFSDDSASEAKEAPQIIADDLLL